jgi:hypothetical protein
MLFGGNVWYKKIILALENGLVSIGRGSQVLL